MKRLLGVLAVVVAVATMAGCAFLDSIGDEFNRSWNGVAATMTTYNESGQPIDRIHGTSFRVKRDERFDTADSDGTSKRDSSVLLISLGDSHISHVGSTMVLAADGLTDIMVEANAKVDLTVTKPGTPWLNDLYEKNRNLWQGKAKTIMVRSQDGTPVAVFSGNNVEVFATDVPKSTQFRVDGRYLFVYRADYTVIDNDLLGN